MINDYEYDLRLSDFLMSLMEEQFRLPRRAQLEAAAISVSSCRASRDSYQGALLVITKQNGNRFQGGGKESCPLLGPKAERAPLNHLLHVRRR